MTELNGKKLTGRIAADRIRMTSTPKPPKGAVDRPLLSWVAELQLGGPGPERGVTGRRA